MPCHAASARVNPGPLLALCAAFGAHVFARGSSAEAPSSCALVHAAVACEMLPFFLTTHTRLRSHAFLLVRVLQQAISAFATEPLVVKRAVAYEMGSIWAPLDLAPDLAPT